MKMDQSIKDKYKMDKEMGLELFIILWEEST